MKNSFLCVVLCLFWAVSPAQDTLQTVIIKKSSKGITKSRYTPTNTSVMTSKELLKAACCNLAESFETNPSIDVNYSDALTGTKQIRMLGLTSPYLLVSEENIPSVRGASQTYGLTFTPGTWIESIQITKGAGSVVNGYESISGQINSELIKPLGDIPFFLNAYGSTDSRFELNSHFNRHFSDKWSSSLFLHGNSRLVENDMNHDGFLDNPLGQQINILNRWQYTDAENGFVGFANLRYMNDRKQSGQVGFDPGTHRFSPEVWGSEINTERYDISTKIGYVFKDMPYQSLGFQNAFSRHNQRSYFGFNEYNILHDSFYSNLIFNSIISNTMHKFATGLNFVYDRYDEFVATPGLGGDFDRTDTSLGAFFEYTYDNSDNFSLVAGARVDSHNRLGVFATPRLHMRYNPWDRGVLRASAGRGKRAANIFAENQQLFASSRQFMLYPAGGEIYGLDPEIAWNYGVSFNQQFELFGLRADAGFDVYRTDFENQAVVDWVTSADELRFYNLDGRSFANSAQVDFNIEPIRHLQLRTAYKFYDIQTDYLSGRAERPLQAKHRFFANAEYTTHETDKGSFWRFDYTWNWTGAQQMPDTSSNAPMWQLGDSSRPFSVMNAQVTRVFSPAFELYLGGENLGNYKQDRAILGADDPFGSDFDASVVYAPVFGRMFYAGLRLRIN